MLKFLNKDVQNIIIKVMLGLIILVFIFLGFGGYNTKQEGLVAKINGQNITKTDYNNIYNRMVENLRKQLIQAKSQKGLTEDLVRQLNLKQRALDEIKKMILLKEEAKKLNITVSTQEVIDSIKNYPAFQDDSGKFNLQKYQYVLQMSRISPAEFEEDRKRVLLLSKVENIITDSVQISEMEVSSEYKRKNEKVTVSFMLFDPVNYKNEVKITDDELKQYYDANSESFKIPKKTRVEILAFENDVYTQKVIASGDISETDINNYYESNKTDFVNKAQANISHILIKADIGADPQIREEAKKKASDLLQKINNGEDFAEVAKKNSQDAATAMNGGVMGWFSKEEDTQDENIVDAKGNIITLKKSMSKLDKAIEDAAFTLKTGEVSSIVETKDGYHIIKVIELKEESQKELSSVKGEIIKRLSKIKGKKLIEDLTREARKEVFVSKNLADYAAKHDIKLLTPEPFAANEPVKWEEKIDDKNSKLRMLNIKFNNEISNIAQGDVSDIIDLDAGSYIAKIVEEIPAKTPPFEEIKEERVRPKLVNEVKSKELAESKANEALKKVRSNSTFEAVAKEYNLPIKVAESFPREGAYAPTIGISEELVNTAFGLSGANPYPAKIFNVNNKFYLIKFVDKKEITIDGYKKERPFLLKQLRMAKGERMLSTYIEELMSKADVKLIDQTFSNSQSTQPADN